MSTDRRQAVGNCLVQCCRQDLEDILLHESTDEHYGVPISLALLANCDIQLVEALIKQPKDILKLLDEGLVTAQETIIKTHASQASMQVKPNVHARLHSLPWAMDPVPHSMNPTVGRIGAFHLNKLLAVTGTVVKACAVRMLEAQQMYECARCKDRFPVDCLLEAGAAVQLPSSCPLVHDGAPCTGTKFTKLEGAQGYTAYQEVRVQERGGGAAPGAAPSSLTVILQHELADRCHPGDDVEVTGVLVGRCGSLAPGRRCFVEPALVACDLALLNKMKAAVPVPQDIEEMFEDFWQAHEQQPMLGRSKILASICPQICGLANVKLAVVLTLLGGVPRKAENGTQIRGEVHTLLIGDPGTGKSQMMRFAASVSPRSVLTSGKSSSGAGLTVSAVKEGGQWTLEAGALVLADGGLCCIDEFGCIKEADMAMIHEAMEQQTLSVAKAGMVTSLSTRAAVLAVTNPKGNAPPQESLAGLSGLSTPMLSRFDIVLMLLDEHKPDWDGDLADHILAAHMQMHPGNAIPQTSCWSIEVLQRYIAWAKSHFQPVLTPAAEAVLLAYYRLLRKSGERCASRTTIRMLEGLVRISQAHARLMAHPVVRLMDAVAAVGIVEAGQTDPCILMGQRNALYSAFSMDPDGDHEMMQAVVLAALNLQSLVDTGGDDGGAPHGLEGEEDPDADFLFGVSSMDHA